MPDSGEDTSSVLAGVGAILEALQNFGTGTGARQATTQDLVYYMQAGSSLQSFVCPFDLDIVSIFNGNFASDLKVSMSGRTTFPNNQLCGNEGGFVAFVGRGTYWKGRFRCNFNDQIWINVPIGSAVSFTVEARSGD